MFRKIFRFLKKAVVLAGRLATLPMRLSRRRQLRITAPPSLIINIEPQVETPQLSTPLSCVVDIRPEALEPEKATPEPIVSKFSHSCFLTDLEKYLLPEETIVQTTDSGDFAIYDDIEDDFFPIPSFCLHQRIIPPVVL